MPPRRPGGKYKGMIVRAKGEATLAEEARLANVKKREELAKKLYDKRQAALLLSHGMQSAQQAEEEAKKQRVMAMLLGGKKGNTKKFFKAWTIGLAVLRKERYTADRKGAWLKACGCSADHVGPCHIHTMLRDATFELPFDSLQRTLGSMAGYDSDAMWRSRSVPALTAGRSPLSATAGQARGLPALPAAPGPPQASFDQGSGLQRTAPGVPPPRAAAPAAASPQTTAAMPNFSREAMKNTMTNFNRETAHFVVHHRTGRRCLLDKETMRMVFDDIGMGGTQGTVV